MSEKEPTLNIKKKKYSGNTNVISVRIPKDMVADIDELAKFTGHSRNEIMQMSLEFALKHMQIENED